MLTKADEGGRGGKLNADHCWRRGVSQMLTIADGGGRGGPGTPDFGWRNMWTAPYALFVAKSTSVQNLGVGRGQDLGIIEIAP